MTQKLAITLFHSETDKFPETKEFTWEELAEGFFEVTESECLLETCKRADCTYKKGMAWSAATWPEGQTRAKETVREVSAFVGDFDHLSNEELDSLVDSISSYQYILHASHSDRPGDRCVRIIFAVSRPILGKEYSRFWRAVSEQLNLRLDQQTKDASRLFFNTSRPKDACHDIFDGSGFDCAQNEGAPLDVDLILSQAPEEPEQAPRTVCDISDFKGAPSEDNFWLAIDALGQVWPNAPIRHDTHLMLSGALARAGWPAELIADFCYEVADIQQPGNGDLGKRLKTAQSSIERLQNGEDVKGWPSLEEHIDSEVIQDVCQHLGIGLPKPNEDLVQRLNARAKVSIQREKEWQLAEDVRVKEAERHVSSQATQALTPRNPSVPTRLQIESDLELAKEHLKKSKDADRRHDGKLIAKVLKKEYLTEHRDDDRHRVLVQAAVALARAVRPGTLPAQIEDLLLPVAGVLQPDVPEAVAFGMKAALDTGPFHVPGPRQANDPRETGAPDDDSELRDQLEVTREGDVRNAGHNVERILRYSSELKEYLRFNCLSKRIEVCGGRFAVEGIDGLPVGIKNWLGSHWSLNTSTTEVSEQLLRVARTWCAYDPVAEYLEELEWDGIPRLGDNITKSWLTKYCRANDTPYVRKVGTRFLISAVARALDPGCKVDTVLVLEGPQGLKKSTTLSILGGAWFSDTPLIMGDKDSRLLAACKWIVELAELKSLLRDDEASKGFLSQKSDDFRPPYGRGTETFLRRCVFGGSTNEHEYLQDATGNRRYWAVLVGKCKSLDLKMDRDQLWAEAVFRYRSAELNPDQAHEGCPGERWWYEDDEQVEADSEIASRRSDDPWVLRIKDWVAKQTRPGAGVGSPKKYFTLGEIGEFALSISIENMKRQSKQISQAMREAGLDRVLLEGNTERVWVRRGSVVLQQHPVDPGAQSEVSGVSDSN